MSNKKQTNIIGVHLCKETTKVICDKLINNEIEYLKIYKETDEHYLFEVSYVENDMEREKLNKSLIKKAFYNIKEFYIMHSLNCTEHFYIEFDFISNEFTIENDYKLKDHEIDEICQAIENIEKSLTLFEFMNVNMLIPNITLTERGINKKATLQEVLNLVLKAID